MNVNKVKKETNLLKNKKIVVSIIIILIICILIILFKDKLLKIIYPEKYSDIVTMYANEYNVDKNLIMATIKAESNFNKTAVSNKGAIGLMQLMEETAKDIFPKVGININQNQISEQLKKSDINIQIGTKYLSILIEKYKNIELALTAYNAGSGNVDNWIEKGILKSDGSNIEQIPYKETNNYVRQILRDYKIYSNLYN